MMLKIDVMSKLCVTIVSYQNKIPIVIVHMLDTSDTEYFPLQRMTTKIAQVKLLKWRIDRMEK